MSQPLALVSPTANATMYTYLTTDIVNKLLLLRNLNLPTVVMSTQETFYSHKTNHSVITCVTYPDSLLRTGDEEFYIRVRYHMNNVWEFYFW